MQVAEFFATLGLNVDKGSFAAGDRALGGVKSGVLKLGAAVAGALGVDALKDMVKETVELGSTLNDTAQKTGLSTDALQFLGYAAKLNSGSMEGVAFAANKMSRNLLEAEKGTGEAKDALHELGIVASDPKFKNLTVDEKFAKIAAQLAKLPDGSRKSALAMQVFGRSGAELIPTINDLGKNGAKLRREFEDFGGSLTGEQVGALDDFGDDVDRLKTRLSILRNQVVVAVLPALQKMLTGLMDWITANKAVIASGIKAALEAVLGVVKALGEAFVFFSEHKDVLAVLAAVGAAFYAWFNPVQAIIVAVIALIHYWPQISAAARAAWLRVRESVSAAWDYIKSIPGRIADAFSRAWDGVLDAGRAALEALANLPVIKQLIEIYRYFTSRSAAQQAAASSVAKAQSQLADAHATGTSGDIAKAQLAYDQAQAQQRASYGGGNGVFGILQQQQLAGDQAAVAATAATGTTVITSVGDINVTVPAGSDADGIAKAVRTQVQQVINQAHDAVKGGVK